MIFSNIFFFSSSFFFGALASPFHSGYVLSRNDPSPAINATIVDHKGLDITSSFQIMVYRDSEHLASLNNFSDRRRQPATLSRPIMYCPTPNCVFIDSICTYGDGEPSG